MANNTGQKFGGRTKGTENKTTREIRTLLKEVINSELVNIEKLLIEMQPKERLDIVLKLIPYVLPKIETVKPSYGEATEFDWGD